MVIILEKFIIMGFCHSKIKTNPINNSKIKIKTEKNMENKIGFRNDYESENICRICLEELYLESFCKCKGSCKWIHRDCLIRWINVSGNMQCQICKEQFNIEYDRGIEISQNIDGRMGNRNTNNRNFSRRRVYNSDMRNRPVDNIIERLGYNPILINLPGIVH